jgi:hypothetical protein
MQQPVLSVVVVIVSDTTESRASADHLGRCLDALTHQVDAPPTEIIVPYHPNVSGMEAVQARFPDVRFLRVDDLRHYSAGGGSREHHDELRARGLAAARGQLIGLLEDHARPDPAWSARIVDAHRQPYAAIGGAIENGIDRPLNWAVYFCDFGRYQNPVVTGDSPFASDANIVYKRSALDAVAAVWRESFQETAVNAALTARGHKLALSPGAVVYQERTGLNLGQAITERFVWGRSYAAARVRGTGLSKRLVYAGLAPLLPGVLVARMSATAFRKGRARRQFARAFPFIALLIASWSCGELVGYALGQPAEPGAVHLGAPATS